MFRQPVQATRNQEVIGLLVREEEGRFKEQEVEGVVFPQDALKIPEFGWQQNERTCA
jgi:hypothetical protein